jgi:hypothetical protein
MALEFRGEEEAEQYAHKMGTNGWRLMSAEEYHGKIVHQYVKYHYYDKNAAEYLESRGVI